MLERLYHTWLGGFIVNVTLAFSWVLGGGLVFGTCMAMADFSYGMSLFPFATLVLDSKRTKQLIFLAVIGFEIYAGPKDTAIVGFSRYWTSWVVFATLAWLGWFAEFRQQPAFLKLFFNLDGSKYYSKCELRGAIDDIQKEGSIFGFHPHGILCVGFAMNGMWNKAFHEVAGSNTQFAIDRVLREENPLMKVFADWHGGMTTLNSQNLKSMISERKNVAFVPGGFQDATYMVYGEESTAMQSRTGFIKYALEGGYRLHPCYTFGESRSFYTTKAFLNFRLWLNKFGIPGVVFFGLPWLPLLPRCDAEYYTYVGKAIQLPQISKPSSHDVEYWHGEYLKGLQDVFEQNKIAVGLDASAKLKIL